MTIPSTSVQVVSGVPYRVAKVDDRRPTGLDDFVGSMVRFTAGRGQVLVQISGEGCRHEPGVRFHEKAEGNGKDVRVWLITDTDDGSFDACAESAF